MPIYISRGRFTSDAVKGMLAKPENREEAVAKLFKSVGGRLIGAVLIERVAHQAITSPSVAALRRATNNIPIVFAIVASLRLASRRYDCGSRTACARGGRYGLRLGATNGLVSTPARLFLSKHASRRPKAALLPSSGTRSVAPSPLTSRTSAVRNLSLRARSTKAIVTALASASAFASTDREPATRRMG